MTLRIRPYTERHWRRSDTPSHDPRVTDIENWPHAFDEHPDRWTKGSDGKVYERNDYAGCRICGASELSQIHLVTA